MRVGSMCVALGSVLIMTTALWAQEEAPVDIIEGRVPVPAAVGTRQPEVGVEMATPLSSPSIFKTRDGRLMMLSLGSVRYSDDNGLTWTRAQSLSVPVKFATRLRSGKLGGPGPEDLFYVSGDDGQTWDARGKMLLGKLIGPVRVGSGADLSQAYVPAWPYSTGGGAVLIQTRSGRILMPTRFTSGSGSGGYNAGSWGILNGEMVAIEGHSHAPEPDITYVFYSGDEGRTWKRTGGLMIWHKEGYGGLWPVDEPTIVEALNGDIVLYFRTSIGRVYTSRSQAADYIDRRGRQVQRKPGDLFDKPQPTSLSGSYSPCTIRRVPKTGDLLIVWNQVSGEEMRAGYRRGRLSSAISRDDGKTWQHFRTIDRVVLPPAGRVEPDPEPRMGRGLDYVGELPEDFGHVGYPTLEIIDETVFVCWSRSVVRPRQGDVTGKRMRVLPLSWFYEDEEPLPPGPKLVLKVPAGGADSSWNTFEIPSDYYEQRFYVRSKELEPYLKSPIGRLDYGIYAPLHQVITCLGWEPVYDRGKLEDADDPRMVAYCTHPRAAHPPIPSLRESE